MSSNGFKLTKLTESHDFPEWYVDLRDYCEIQDILQYYDLPPMGTKSETIQADRPIAPIPLALYREKDKIYHSKGTGLMGGDYAEVNDKAPSQARCPVSSKHEMTLETIQAWHKQCMKNHQKCKQFPQLTSPIDQYPTRLLDVTGSRIRLVSEVEAFKPDYTTLSHMWGPDPKLCLSLKTTNIDDFKIDIPESLLAVKYLDAIRITRALGYSYIWIDSLCIIQDSAEDWKREALKMAAVYGRTSCNFSSSTGATLPTKFCPQTSTSDASTSPEASPFLIVRTTSRSAQWTTNTQGISWPLLTRAWVFQERLMCPRNIYYGAGFLLWECGEMVEDEFLGSVARGTEIGGKRVLYPIFSGTEDLAGDSQRKDTFNYQWFSLVGEYRMRNLTYETDRSIAFAGIARAIQTHTGYTYLAGMWKEFAVYGMLWHVSVSWFKMEERRDFCARRETTAKSAPSWSWFSVPGHWGERVIRDVVRPLFCIATYECSSYAIYEARVTSFHHPKLKTDPTVLFHDYMGLEITLRTRRIPCALEWDAAGTGKQVLRVLPFGSHIKGNRAAETTDPRYTGMRVDCQYGGLVVVPAGKNAVGQACWRRVGVFLFSGHVDDPDDTKYPFDLHGGEDEDVVLV
ncbi:unnamed protein product [Parascedosporium putredinis]|uniref:Heterokaryon incompatibility domain-containing protein n=1 Tax=Parascedosporium putredinis TaxID=1442378 RepID=A0A9P1H5T7_9PEZI|nr:unnamed protein product [Parascedosporium putredinis]CAI7996755.1 unnamed protein product [Parascedosporium putredinis]